MKRLGIYTSLVMTVLMAGIFFVGFPATISSRSLSEINEELEEQKEELDDAQSDLESAKENLQQKQAALDNAQGEVPRLEAEIDQLAAEIEYNESQMELLKQQKKQKQLEQERREKQQAQSLKQAYFSWRTRDIFGQHVTSQEETSTLKKDIYQAKVLNQEEQDLEKLAGEILGLKNELTSYAEETTSLEEKTKQLQDRKKEIELRIARLNSTIGNQRSQVSNLRAQVGTLQANVEQLQKEQKEIQEYEARLLAQEGNGASQEIAQGEYYFSGQGRDLYQGHGVGMSQFGAFGAALNGWSAEDIVTFYYSNTHVEERSGTVAVADYGTMNANEYVAGLGEVPSKACGTKEQAQNNPQKYVEDNPNTIWDCWPEEAIKAQVIAARSYALHYNGTICTSAACQVYEGGNDKQWAADETANQVIVSDGYTHTGQIINALYSSDNNQGHGTANNDTVFSSMNGEGTAYSYLRHVDDTNFAYEYQYTNWGWRTNGYTMQDFTEMLDYVDQNSSLGYAHNFINGVLNDIDALADISFERDSSQRVNKVVLHGTNGQKRKIAGWLFKAIWNAWVNNEKPSGEVDYIYSLTFYMVKKD